MQNILRNRIFIYLLGIIIGVLISFTSFNIYSSMKISDIQSKVQSEIANYNKVENMINSNKDFIIAGLLLSEDNQNLLDYEMSKMSKEKSEKVNTYIDMRVNPLYKDAAYQHLKTNFKGFDFSGFKNTLILKIKGKIELIFSTISSNIKSEINSHMNIDQKAVINKIGNAIIVYVKENVNVDKEQLFKNLKKYIYQYLTENNEIDISKFSYTIQNLISDYFNKHLNLNISVENIKNKVNDYLDETVDLNKVFKSIKQSINYYIDKNINLDIILQNIKDTILEFLIDSNLLEDINILIGKINFLFSDVDNDYKFEVININGNIIDLSFLNIIDLYIDPTTVIYNDEGTKLNFLDDSLIIKDIYINFEALDGTGIDIIIGNIHISGRVAYFVYKELGVINEEI